MNEPDSKSARGRPKKMDAERVLDMAMTAYWQGDPVDVSVNLICKMAEVSKPSIYREFQSEDGLTHAALESYAQSVLGKLLTIAEAEDSFSSKIEKIAHSFAIDETHKNGCLFVKMRAIKTRMGPKTQDLIEELDRMAIDTFAKMLREAQASGEWSGNIPIELGARYLHTQFGLALDQRARGQDPQDTLAIALSALEA